MSDAQTVTFWCMRHGKKETGPDPGLTELGVRQVQASAAAYLQGVELYAAYHSGMRRTEQTARTVLAVLNERLATDLYREEGFGYTWLLEDPATRDFSIEEAQAAIKMEAERPFGKETAGLWLKHYPPSFMIRGRLRQALSDIAIYELGERMVTECAHAETEPEGDLGLQILVASHTPLIELATPNPEAQICINEADIIRFKLEVPDDPDPMTARIVEAVHLPCPLKQE